MTGKRVSIGVIGIVVAALVGWNLRLQAELKELRQQAGRAAPRAGKLVAGDVLPGVEAGGRPGVRVSDRPVRTAAEHRGARPGAERSLGAAEVGRPASEVQEEGRDGTRSESRRPDWEAIRTDMDSRTVELVDAFAERLEWSPSTADEVIAIMLEASDEIGALWAQAHEDGRSRYQTHREMEEIRADVADEVEALIGVDAHEALQEELWEARREIFHSSRSSNGAAR